MAKKSAIVCVKFQDFVLFLDLWVVLHGTSEGGNKVPGLRLLSGRAGFVRLIGKSPLFVWKMALLFVLKRK